MNSSDDERIVLTLDAGGTHFRFFAVRGSTTIAGPVVLPSDGNDLDKCLGNIVEGFTQIRNRCPELPVAISFAFPGPADYPNGIIGDPGNLPGFRGGIALGPMLRNLFGVPVYINNDGDLFTYGEAIAGFLPYINGLLGKAGSSKRYKNLFGIMLGTGFGGGIVSEGRLLRGDNSISGEVWLLRNRLHPEMNAEEGASIRAVRRVYAEKAGIALHTSPEPKEIYEIGRGEKPGNREAALEAFRCLGIVIGDALANALTLLDGPAVIGGGIAEAWPLFAEPLLDELNGSYRNFEGDRYNRLASVAFNLEDSKQRETFLEDQAHDITIPGSDRVITYDPMRRIGVGISRLGTSRAIATGAYIYALSKLDERTV